MERHYSLHVTCFYRVAGTRLAFGMLGPTAMWNKRTDELSAGPVPAPAPAPSQDAAPIRKYAAPPAPPAAPPSREVKQVAVIGTSMTIKGEIRSREELLVDGDVEGLLESQSLLTVGSNGKVKANIKAREVVVFGSVRGNIEVTEKIAIRDAGSVIGDIKTSGISIDDGAYFKGNIDISRPEPKSVPKPETEVPAGAAHG
jgi:cytoskeletal protein CcmA (bactofilin family)